MFVCMFVCDCMCLCVLVSVCVWVRLYCIYQFPMAQIFVDLCHCRLEPGFGQTVFQEQYMDLAHNLNSMVLDLSYDMGFYVLGSGLTVWPEPKVKYTKKYLNTSLLSSDG